MIHHSLVNGSNSGKNAGAPRQIDDVDFVCYRGHVNLLPAVFSLGLGVSLLPATAQFTPPIRLDAFQEPDGRLRLQSTTAVNFNLEETDSLIPAEITPGTFWHFFHSLGFHQPIEAHVAGEYIGNCELGTDHPRRIR